MKESQEMTRQGYTDEKPINPFSQEMNILQQLQKAKLVKFPDYVLNCQYLTIMGSQAYGIKSKDSDIDLYGFCIPPKEIIFPFLAKEIEGFGTKQPRFNQFQIQHIFFDKQEYDITVYSIVKYFHLCMENNPNMIDSLFTEFSKVLIHSEFSRKVRVNRHIFLHKGCYYKFSGYAHSQIQKAKNRNPIGKRLEVIEKYGWDVKYGYHLVRLMLECEQILTEGNLDLEQNVDILTNIKEGKYTLEWVLNFFVDKEKYLKECYEKSKLPERPNEKAIKNLLLECLEQHYGEKIWN